MIPEYDIFVHLMNLPGSAYEAVTQNEDGTYSVFIDAQLSPQGQKKAYEHALEHIQGLDFEKQNVQEIEAHAHHVQPIPDKKESTLNVAKIAAARKPRRKSTKKQWHEVNERVEFIKRHDPDYFFKQGEYNKLYGGI